MLLQWCTLEPSGPSQLAALRFSSPVRIQSISIFPTNYQPFALNPDVVSRTEPEAFFLELYFNAHPVSQPQSKEKVKPTNVLMPTVVAYAGGRMDFPVNMSLETATRLMVVKGPFQSVSMAIYGDVVSEKPSVPSTYEPKHLASLDPIPLHSSLDTSTFLDPTKVAKQLLQLIPEAPPLHLVVRLMFCLKPGNEEWDSPDFPYLYADLEEFSDDQDIEQASVLTLHPVADDTSESVLHTFAGKVAQAIGPKDDNQAWHFAKLLSHVACQHPGLARAIIESVEMADVFDASSLDEDTLERVLDAAANTDIARAFNVSWFLDLLTSIAQNGRKERELRSLARRLLARLEGLPLLDDAILNTQGDFSAAALTVKDICTQERSFGIWLASMITHQDLVDKLSENPPVSVPSQYPPTLFAPSKSTVSHEEFIAFLRAVIGVSSVLAVYAWADSLPHQHCRERALGILRLWQGVDGYREILNHLLLSRQMIFRLECMFENELPTQAGIDAEHILVDLARDPHAILHPELTKSILSLEPPHCFITQEERHSMQEAAEIAEDSLSGAVECVLQPLEQPVTGRSIRKLRVALAILDRDLDDQKEPEILHEFWDRGNCSLQTCLTEVYVELSEEICKYFTVHPSPPLAANLMPELFRASDQTIAILLRLVPHYPLTGRITRTIIKHTADLFASTDLIDLIYAQTSPTCIAAQQSRQACIDVVRSLAVAPEDVKGGPTNAELVLRTLLAHGLDYGDREPTHHLLQAFSLIDHLLPMPDDDLSRSSWTQSVLPSVLRELWAFCAALDPESKAHLVRRLVRLDRDAIGVGDWLLQQELKEVLQTLEAMNDSEASPQYKLIRQYQITLSLRFFLDLMASSSSVSEWCINVLVVDPDASHIVAMCLEKLGEINVISSQLEKMVHAFAAETAKLSDEVKLPVALTLLRICQFGQVSASGITSSLYLAHTILLTLPSHLVKAQTVAYEISALLYLLSGSPHLIEGDVPDALLGILEWLDGSDDPAATTIQGISSTTFSSLCDKFRSIISVDKQPFLSSLQQRLKFPAQEGVARSAVTLPDNAELSIHDLEDLLRPPVTAPFTPAKRALNQDALSTVTISPPTAVIRSPAATGLTKTYSNNDFRQLRQTASARQNTSRLPSMHVDDFENAASPTLLPLPMSVPVPLAGSSTMPFAAAAPASLSPVLKLL
ncbi:hypothetical protein BDW22DRAFT_1359560 [Trametopsis cervina]|nr:hypothetical protein BDW22DRAFT_1359560 [Trametopsis cervina]